MVTAAGRSARGQPGLAKRARRALVAPAIAESQELPKITKGTVELRLRAAAGSQDRGLAGGALLGHVQYDFSVKLEGHPPVPFGRIAFTVGPPPQGKVSEVTVQTFPPFTRLDL
jgi:hypothetical protein